MRFTSDSNWKSLLLPIKKLNMKKLIIALTLITSINSVSAQKYTDQYIKDASKVAETWLSNINNQQYKNAYNLCSKEYKVKYTKEIWTILMGELMLEFGGLESRKATEKKFQSEVEGMEDGFYVFIDYTSSYRNTMNHNEQVILKQNDKTNWEIISFDYIWQNRNPKE
jgi:hypothetical protein|tara:strand:- start:365 stop:868 length:504 start_codon:yes stop_codon:yes gene_type:complete